MRPLMHDYLTFPGRLFRRRNHASCRFCDLTFGKICEEMKNGRF